METKIYLVKVKTTYMKNSNEVDFENWGIYKAFTTIEKAREYTRMVEEYLMKDKKENITHETYIQEVELA